MPRTISAESTLKAGQANLTRLLPLPSCVLIEGKRTKKENTYNWKITRLPFVLGLPTTCPKILLLSSPLENLLPMNLSKRSTHE